MHTAFEHTNHSPPLLCTTDPDVFNVIHKGRLYGHVRLAEAAVLVDLLDVHGANLVLQAVLASAASRSPKGYLLRLQLICEDDDTAACVLQTLDARGVLRVA
jgi:hypothetical protein